MDNKLFDATVDLKLRQFYILAYGGSIASILGFVTNIFIYGFTGPTFFLRVLHSGGNPVGSHRVQYPQL